MGDPELREHLLRAHDLAMLANAANYDYRHLALSGTEGQVTVQLRWGADGRRLADGRASLRSMRDEHHDQAQPSGATLRPSPVPRRPPGLRTRVRQRMGGVARRLRPGA